MKGVILDVLKDSSLVFIVVLVFNFIISFFEKKIANKLAHNKLSPVLASVVGLVPQCGFSIVGADLYNKNKISIGTLLAVFIACSDEALPILLASNKYVNAIILICIKVVLAIGVGILVDWIYYRKKKLDINEDEEFEIHKGCCHHHIEKEDSFVKEHILHPLLHSLKILVYILIINFIFTYTIYLLGEDKISAFLMNQKYLTPLLSVIIGLIPNCAPSIILCELFINNALPFAALLSGLICNSGLGLLFILKNKNNFKNNLLIFGILIFVSLISGYIALIFM